jgi:hypothetical protein
MILLYGTKGKDLYKRNYLYQISPQRMEKIGLIHNSRKSGPFNINSDKKCGWIINKIRVINIQNGNFF